MESEPKLLPATHAGVRGPVVVAVLDGVGLGPQDEGNAFWSAATPFLDQVMASCPWRPLAAHGPAVGLADARDMGNSEVGHNALGAGQIVDQGAKRVAQAIADGSLFAGAPWQAVVARCSPATVSNAGRAPGALHFVALLSDGNVHSHIDHLLALLDQADGAGVQRAFVHALLDGRDVGRTSALAYVDRLEQVLARINAKPSRRYLVASGGGRMQLTMDRYQADWPMVARGWRHHVHAQGRVFAHLRQAVETLRAERPGVGDQDLPGFVLHAEANAEATEEGTGHGPIVDGDAVVLVNFRGDRMLQLVDAFAAEAFTGFDRGRRPNVLLAGMTLYDGDTARPRHFLVAPPRIDHTFGELLSRAGLRQLACAETQKFGHVTYFWNGNRSQPFSAERERAIEVPSLPAPFDAHPAMRAEQIVDATEAALRQDRPHFVRLNFANGDMVGHTGELEATRQAMAAVDAALARLKRTVVDELAGALIITADHGNAEDMVERSPDGTPRRDAAGALVAKTSHSLNPVPCIFVLTDADRSRFALCTEAEVPAAGLANVAASCACLLGLVPPANLWQPSLLRALAPT